MAEGKSYNPIGYLNEFSQKHKNEPVTIYSECTSSVTNPFSYKCSFGHNEVVSSGHTKKEAKRNAAQAMITLLKKENYFEKFRLNARSSDNVCLPGKVNSQTLNSVVSQTSNPISLLNQYCQSNRIELPVYTEAHLGSGFVFSCKFKGEETHSYAFTKKSAKVKAASEMCKKLNLRFTEGNDQPSEKDDYIAAEKNPVVTLNEMLAFTQLKPVYEMKPSVRDSYVIICVVGQISGEGRDITKKGAKLSAANQVLQKLSKIKIPAEVRSFKLLTGEILPPVNFIVNPCDEQIEENSLKPVLSATCDTPNTSFLKDFDLNSDEE